MLKVLVFGGSGQLGQCIAKVAFVRNLGFLTFPDTASANILDTNSLEKLFDDVKPSHVINCAAYTAVDKAEDDVDLCRLVNKEGALNLAELCVRFGASLIHVSTDFVFGGSGSSLLIEDSIAVPIMTWLIRWLSISFYGPAGCILNSETILLKPCLS
jgi:dTDP-4-dehydrorhamnose reductase